MRLRLQLRQRLQLRRLLRCAKARRLRKSNEVISHAVASLDIAKSGNMPPLMTAPDGIALSGGTVVTVAGAVTVTGDVI